MSSGFQNLGSVTKLVIWGVIVWSLYSVLNKWLKFVVFLKDYWFNWTFVPKSKCLSVQGGFSRSSIAWLNAAVKWIGQWLTKWLCRRVDGSGRLQQNASHSTYTSKVFKLAYWSLWPKMQHFNMIPYKGICLDNSFFLCVAFLWTIRGSSCFSH